MIHKIDNIIENIRNDIYVNHHQGEQLLQMDLYEIKETYDQEIKILKEKIYDLEQDEIDRIETEQTYEG